MPKRLDALGDRMKSYEKQETDQKFLPMIPVYARIDGRSFSKFTKGMSRPYDVDMSEAMKETTKYLVEQTGSVTGYTQSDEISLVFYQDNPKGDIFFAGKKQKMCSQLAALATAKFLQIALEKWPDKCAKCLPAFDCRVFQVPNETEAMNQILWRVQDAVKNSITMAASSVYSHKQLLNKNSKDKLDMLMEKGINWNDYPQFFKEGSFFKRHSLEVETPNGTAERTIVAEVLWDDGTRFSSLSSEGRVRFVMSSKVKLEVDLSEG